ncbi:MAG TPA: hypothetical protein VJ141_01660 [Candidatus Limnocylindrales bacterium]|nr:hypothetical protein [Candidatus Limnocylindrales bacterium]
MLRTATPRGTAWQGFGVTARRDRWWLEPAITGTGFALFIVYSLFSAFVWLPLFGVPYEAEGYLSPFFSPLFGQGILPPLTPAVLILWAPLGFRATCYYYRKFYYRAYFADPPACAVGEPRPHARYALERRLPFILQNLHRFFLYAAFVPLFFLWIDAFISLRFEGHWRIGLGSAILFVNVALLSGYSLSCHSLRHLVGGRLDCFSCSYAARARHGAWRFLTVLNQRHMQWAWASLIAVALADLFVRLLAAGVISDPRILL